MKRMLYVAIFLTACVFAGGFPVPAAHAADNPCGFPYNDGAYEIGSVGQLICLSNNQPSYLSGNIRLTADVDFGVFFWNPIGTVDDPFTGTFDGNGHVIKNLQVDGLDRIGLFGVVDGGTIKNVGLSAV